LKPLEGLQPEEPDAAFVRRVVAGDVDAFAILVQRYRPRCGRFAAQMMGSVEDAEEVVQESFVRAFRALRSCDPERFGAWLFRIVANRCRTARLRRSRREKLVLVSDDALRHASVGHGQDDVAWREEISRALATLPVEQREAFLLKHVEDLSYEEMAVITRTGVSALKMRVKRACDRLRVLLAEVER
jgi:RNA polymerase sigma-70 factor (ECF subfamily)